MKTFQRGDTIRFKVSGFADFDGNVLVPESVTCRISYLDGGMRTTATPTMTGSQGIFTGTWDSSVADEGTVDWYLKTVSGTTQAVEQGQFTLSANEANPQS